LERIRQYSTLPPEEPEIKPMPPPSWPQTGKIEWERMGLRYRKGLPPALRNVTCTVKDGEKVGVCGRTGAGKSSMTVGLLRLADEIFGSIKIDGVDHASIKTFALRSKLALIPQEATMFAGDIRLNLDPLQTSTDAELWSVLRQVELEEVVKDAGGLTATVAEDGNNWSQGQRQLLCIARALLKRSRIVMLDEATASCDVTTDAMVQKVIRQVFTDCTVLTIAHRMNTIADSDMIMVLDQGEVAEFDSPQALLKTPGSMYHALVQESEQSH
jgi:ATP-binding cassette subfamily C (CFTR/MRP) protein 1